MVLGHNGQSGRTAVLAAVMELNLDLAAAQTLLPNTEEMNVWGRVCK